MRELHFSDLFSHPAHFFALGFGSGLSPRAPGTAGTLIALPLYWLAMTYLADIYIWLVVFISLVGVYLCGTTARNLQSHDHGGIVWDEIAGFAITMLWVPFSWQWIAAGFVLFRILDIAKPWPIRWLDRRVGGGWGIMLDDIVAGLIACGVLHAIRITLF